MQLPSIFQFERKVGFWTIITYYVIKIWDLGYLIYWGMVLCRVDFLGQKYQMDFKEYLRWDNAAQAIIWLLIGKKIAFRMNEKKFLMI